MTTRKLKISSGETETDPLNSHKFRSASSERRFTLLPQTSHTAMSGPGFPPGKIKG